MELEYFLFNKYAYIYRERERMSEKDNKIHKNFFKRIKLRLFFVGDYFVGATLERIGQRGHDCGECGRILKNDEITRILVGEYGRGQSGPNERQLHASVELAEKVCSHLHGRVFVNSKEFAQRYGLVDDRIANVERDQYERHVASQNDDRDEKRQHFV